MPIFAWWRRNWPPTALRVSRVVLSRAPTPARAALPPAPQTDAAAAGDIVVHKGGEPLTSFEKSVDGSLSEIAKENASLFTGLTCVPAPRSAQRPSRARRRLFDAAALSRPFPRAAWRRLRRWTSTARRRRPAC